MASCLWQMQKQSVLVCSVPEAYHGIGDNVDAQLLEHVSCCLDLTWRHAF